MKPGEVWEDPWKSRHPKSLQKQHQEPAAPGSEEIWQSCFNEIIFKFPGFVVVVVVVVGCCLLFVVCWLLGDVCCLCLLLSLSLSLFFCCCCCCRRRRRRLQDFESVLIRENFFTWQLRPFIKCAPDVVGTLAHRVCLWVYAMLNNGGNRFNPVPISGFP